MNVNEKALQMHQQWHGKIEVVSRVALENKEDLSVAYTPGVAQPCLEIQKDPEKSYLYTRRGNMVAVITDGTAVLGLGDIGPTAAMPVMEGKCALFKAFADIDAFPLCVNSKDPDEIVKAISLIAPSFGGINLEDIAAPRCFEIESRLKQCCDIPVFHDDQHGTAIIAGAAILNAAAFTGRKIEDITLILNGAGAAGIAIAKLLLQLGVGDIILCDKDGAIYKGCPGLNPAQKEMAYITNKHNKKGSLKEVIRGADAFIGVSKGNLLTKEDVASMNSKAILFAMANPVPEIMPQEALAGGAAVVGTGRSDFPNQINNVLAFPGIFKGALQVRAKYISEGMKLAAAHAIAGIIAPGELRADYILPSPFDKRVVTAVAQAVANKAKEENIARI